MPCSALSTPSFTYDFYSLVTRLQQDSMDLISNAYHCQDSYLQPVHLHRLFPHTPIIPPVTSFQASLFFAPRNILLRTPTTQIVLTYQQHETLYTFTLRHHLIPTLLRTPLYNPIHPSITIQQLHLQHRFLCYDRDISPSLYTRVPQDYLQFQLQSLRGSFYLIDDSQTSVCIVNWTLGKATGSYHTNARTLQTIIHEWYPLDAFFRLTPQEGDTNFATEGRLPHHQKVHFTLSVPRTFYLRSLRVNAPDIALQVTYFDNEFFNWHLSHRFGEATNPGPSLSIISVNVTSLLLHYHLFLSYDIVLVQESRLTEYGQTYLQHILNEQGWSGIWSMPRPPQRNNSDSTNLTGKCGGVAILFRQSLQFQTAPQSLLQNYPCLCSHRFLHGILSTEAGPTLHFMTV